MAPFDPTEVLGNGWVRPIVGLSRVRGPAADGESQASGNGHTDHLTRQRTDIRAEIGVRRIAVRDLPNVRATGGRAEGTDDVGIDQVRVADCDLVVQVVDAVRVDRQRILSIKRRSDIEVPGGKAAENRIFLALLPINSPDVKIFMLVGDVTIFDQAAII